MSEDGLLRGFYFDSISGMRKEPFVWVPLTGAMRRKETAHAG
jgi:hypothetical protein